MARYRGLRILQWNSRGVRNKKNSLETQAITIKFRIGELLIVSIYRVPAAVNIIGSATWTRLLSFISDINAQAAFVGGDFNFHHISWGSPRICLNVDEFCQAIDNTNLICLINGSPTYINRPDNLSSDSMGGEHLPVLVCLGVTIPIATFTSHRYVLKNMD